MKPGDIAAGKRCGDCGLCCKLIGVESIQKPQFTWCRHFKKTAGCGIYEDRPHDCRAFICYWLHVPNLGDEWRPDRSGFVMHITDGGTRLNIEVDPINPQAWKAEPFYSTFKAWAAKGNARGLALLVWVGRRCFEITPDADIDRGMLRAPSRRRGKAGGAAAAVQR